MGIWAYCRTTAGMLVIVRALTSADKQITEPAERGVGFALAALSVSPCTTTTLDQITDPGKQHLFGLLRDPSWRASCALSGRMLISFPPMRKNKF
jgi:hypothetical protein